MTIDKTEPADLRWDYILNYIQTNWKKKENKDKNHDHPSPSYPWPDPQLYETQHTPRDSFRMQEERDLQYHAIYQQKKPQKKSI